MAQVKEEDYFLPLEKHRRWLKTTIQENEFFLRPSARRNEVLAMLEKELPPLCITRPKERVPWGIEVPFSPSHVTYVWFDALLNYISALDWPQGDQFQKYWNGAGAVHLIGKDIIRHHCLYWPIILHALGVDPPKTIFAHGWWLVKGEKMSKSKGNIVEPQAVVEAYGLEAFRYFLLREVPFGDDGIFSEDALVKRINADLANDLGNLVYRTLTMLEKHAAGRIAQLSYGNEFQNQVAVACLAMQASIDGLNPSEALKDLWKFIAWANVLVERTAPWTLAKEGKQAELALFLYQMAESLRIVSILIWPFLPNTAESIWRQLGFDSSLSDVKLSETEPVSSLLAARIPGGQKIRKGEPLFPRVQ